MASPLPSPPRVLIVGSGGIGGVLACHLVLGGTAPWIATTNAAVQATWREGRVTLDGQPLGHAASDAHIVERARGHGPFDVVFVAVQPPQVDEVAASLEGELAEKGRVVCLSNGLCEERLARTLGTDRVIGAVVAWGARMPEPGHYLQTARGGFRVGTLSGRTDDALATIQALLAQVGPVDLTDNLRGARFSKLALNCAVSTLGAISGSTLGELLMRAEARALALSILREAIAIARAEGIRLEPVTRLDLDWLGEPRSVLGRVAQHALLIGVGLRYRRMRSSTLAAMERGRAPAVDFLNGELTERGARWSVPTPTNRAAQEIVWQIATGQLKAGDEALARLIVRARELTTEPQ